MYTFLRSLTSLHIKPTTDQALHEGWERLDPALQLMLKKPPMQDSHIITKKFKMPAHHFADTAELKILSEMEKEPKYKLGHSTTSNIKVVI